MSEQTTQITETVPTPAAAVPRSPPANRVRLAPTQKLTRAHLAINARPSITTAMSEASARVAQKLGPQLKTALTCASTLLPSTIHPFSHLAGKALFVTLEFGGEALAVLELDLLGVGALLGRITGGQEPAGIPTRLSHIEEAALGWVALTSLAELRGEQAFAGLCPRLLSLTLDRGEILRQVDARLRHVAVQLELSIGETRCLGRLLLPALWVQSKFDALPRENPGELLEQVASATVPARCLIGSAVAAGG